MKIHEKMILDGGLGTLLIKDGHEQISSDKMWSADLINSSPQSVINAHTQFLKAGADIIESDTYQASVQGFYQYKQMSVEEAEATVISGNQLACKARDDFWTELPLEEKEMRERPLAVASCGPYGVLLADGSEYTGSYMDTTELQLIKDFHASNLRLAMISGVDAVFFDTIPSTAEALCIIDVLREFPNAHVVISFSCKNGKSICSGDAIEDAFSVLPDSLLAAGINCTSSDNIESLLQRGAHALHKKHIPLILAPNSGASWDNTNRCFNEDGDADIHVYTENWSRYGVSVWGGCCNILPKHIRNLKKAVQSL